jgi:hypothetical protein
MSTPIYKAALWVAAMLAGLCTHAAMANEDRSASNVRPEGAAVARANPLGTKPVDLKALAARRGGADFASEMQLKGVVADTRASNLSTGNNIIADGAFSGTVGLPMVIQNSGNGVLIQNATIVNVQLK